MQKTKLVAPGENFLNYKVILFRLGVNQDQNQMAMMEVRTREVMVEQNTKLQMIVRQLSSSALSAASEKMKKINNLLTFPNIILNKTKNS